MGDEGDSMDLMDQSRMHQNKDNNTYRKLHQDIRKKKRQAKYEEIETLDGRYDIFSLHKKVKELALRFSF